MKKIICLLLLGAFCQAAAQDPAYPPAPAAPLNIIQAEYFVDTDPGFGLGTSISLTPGVDIASLPVTINTTGLIAGAHRLVIRSRSTEGHWSISSIREFIVDFDPAYPTVPAAPQNITMAEYYIDTDPGFGLGTNIAVTPGVDIASLPVTINTTGLLAGTHQLVIRSRSTEGHWSINSIRSFIVDFDPAYPAAPAAPQSVIQAEYFINTDPGFGNGTPVTITPGVNIVSALAAINTSTLTPGSYRIYLRSRNNEGRWSLTAVKAFIVDENPAYPASPAAPGNITYLEYFFDTDPGFGNGTTVTISPATEISGLTFPVNTASLSQGTHNLYIRSFDDWGMTTVKQLMVSSTLPVTFESFSGRVQVNNALLDWVTSSENNSSHFEIERSTDGVRFQTIGSKAAAVNSNSRRDYSFTDPDLPVGTYFYRLKQVDTDGRFKYSAVIRLRVSGKTELVLMPNPAKGLLQVSGLARNSSYQIFDAAGKQMRSGTWNGQSISLEGFAPGMYFLQVQQADQFIRKPFIKQ